MPCGEMLLEMINQRGAIITHQKSTQGLGSQK
jgi:hypothetical protein